MGYKIKAIKLKDNNFFIVKHINSKYYNDYTNTIINIEQLLDELIGYAQNNIIYLEDVLQLVDINNNLYDLEEIYKLLDSLIITNKLMDNNTRDFNLIKILWNF